MLYKCLIFEIIRGVVLCAFKGFRQQPLVLLPGFPVCGADSLDIYGVPIVWCRHHPFLGFTSIASIFFYVTSQLRMVTHAWAAPLMYFKIQYIGF